MTGLYTPAADGQATEDTFTPEQYSWAIGWINGPLETLMAHGVIESISTSDTTFRVQTGEEWKELSFRQAGEILRDFSRARQITGHSPFFTAEQGSTGTVFGRVTQSAITVLIPDEGYFEYFPDTGAAANTAY
jgi:hypothetical protein